MPEVKYGRKDEPSVTLTKSSDLIAVRTRSTRPVAAGPVASPAVAEVRDGTLVAAFPEAGVEVFRVPTGAGYKSLDERKRALRQAPDVRFAGGVMVDAQSGEPVVYTENLFIKFVDSADPDDCRAVIRDAGLTIKREVSYSTNAFFVAAQEGTGEAVFDVALRLLARDDVEYCHPETVRRREMRAIAPQQWHLRPTTIGGVPVNASASVEQAHAVTTGQGTVIAIIDDGVDIGHPEFERAGKVVAPRDVTEKSDDPGPKYSFEMHGTACAGVACADGLFGASGVAPGARLMPIRLGAGLGSQDEADAFAWAADHGADVISCSWGPSDGDWWDPNDPVHNQVVPIPASAREAIDYAVQNGRGGKGCVVLFAAGNGRESVDNDGYASYQHVLAIAACNDRGRRSVYSDAGDAIWCAFPSSDFGHPPFNQPDPLTPGIWTTDRTGGDGYAAGDYTDDFGGTSSACPGAAGVAALILSVNPNLKWHEVRDVMRRASDRIDPQGGAYDANDHSPFYGYGRLNAATAVALARPGDRSSVRIRRTYNTLIPDLGIATAALEVGETDLVDGITVYVDLEHTYIGDLVITLVPPQASGLAPIVLHNRRGGATRDLRREFDRMTTPALAGIANLNALGTWTLKIEDRAAADAGLLREFGLDLRFAAAQPHAAAAGARESAKRPGGNRKRS